jgi:DNA (cytosine-5)-methyltransferase 1
MSFRCADLFSGAGGAAVGLHRAGFEVVGFDINPQKHYPFEFHPADALSVDLTGFDFVWASPPCQAHTMLKTMPNAKAHFNLIPATRARLKSWGGLWIMENVYGAPLLPPSIMLCGTMFGLGVKDAELRRHRYFESSTTLLTLDCHHSREVVCGVYGGGGIRKDRKTGRPRTVGVWGNAGGKSIRDGCQQFSTEERKIAMGIDWMTGHELSQSIPPAYSEFLGRQVMAILTSAQSSAQARQAEV